MTRPPARSTLAAIAGAAALAAGLASAPPARAAEPWSDPDPAVPFTDSHRFAIGQFGFRGGAEYRAQFIYINPISLNTENARATSWIEHRLRLDAGADWRDKIRIVASMDVLDGVLWGDNGTYGGTPSSNSGTHVDAKNPNVTTPCVGLRTASAPLDPQSYGYTACSAQVFTVRKLYGEAVLPFGLLRVGRQPVNIGSGVQAVDGDGRANRFGVADHGNYVDRILFATKPLEAFKPPKLRSTSANEGLILAFAYDRLVTSDPQDLGAAVNQWDTALRFLVPRFAFGSDLLIAGYHAYRWDALYSSHIHALGLRAMSRFSDFHVGFDVSTNLGTTQEISAAYKVITNDPVVDQPVRGVGARAVARYDRPLFSLYLEGDYASGSDDPQARAPLTQFTFAEDANVGLLLFKYALAFQSARSSAAGVEILQRLGATTFPAQVVATNGAFTNALAAFPQLDVRPLPGLLLRGGVLVAVAPAQVIDPIASLQKRATGIPIQNALVNFAGGKPGRFYGTELDGRIQYRFMEHFLVDLEGAILFPGSALEDQDGFAVRSGLFQARTTFFL